MTSCTATGALVLIFALTIGISYKVLRVERQSSDTVRGFLFSRDVDGKEHPLVVAHRGGQYEAPENTLIALKTAKRNGATAVELDLEFTEDGYAVIIHSDALERLTNVTGSVTSLKFNDVRRINAANKVTTIRYADGKTETIEFEQIPTLMEAIQLCQELGLKVILDVKSDPIGTANAIADLYKEIPDFDKSVIVSSFYPSILYMVKCKCPSVLTALIWTNDFVHLTLKGEPRYTGLMHHVMYYVDIIGDIFAHSWLPDFLGFEAILLDKKLLSRRYLHQWRARNVDIIAWTANNPLEKEYFVKNLKVSIITDSLLNSEFRPTE